MDFNTLQMNKTSNKYKIYVISFIVTLLVILIAFKFLFAMSVVSGDSMEPTLKNNDMIFCLRTNITTIKRGDIVIFKSNNTSKSMVKRIVAEGGDTVKIDDGRVYVNDQLLDEPYVIDGSYDYKAYDGLSVIVPTGYYFVLGDNRPVSVDSRSFGYIPKSEIEGKVIYSFK